MEDPTIQSASLEFETEGHHEMDGKHLTFWIDEQLFGIPIVHVVQIVGVQSITEVPEFPSYAKGIIDLRGVIIPLIDVRLRLGKPEVAYNERTCIIVTEIDQNHVGLIVDEVDAVLTIADDAVSTSPKLSEGSDGYLTGIGRLEDKIVLLINPRKVIGVEALELLATANY